MSLILEALKKSEQQRRLGEAPTLGSPALGSRRRRSALPLIVALIALALGAGWWMLRPTSKAPLAQTDKSASPTPSLAASKPATAAAQPPRNDARTLNPMLVKENANPPANPSAPTQVAAIKPDRAADRANAATNRMMMPLGDRPGSVAQLPPALPMVAGPMATPAPAKPTPAPTVAPIAATPKPELPTAAATPAPANATAATPPPKRARAEPALPSVWELPYAMRKDLPELALTMHVYSDDPHKRFVVIKGDRHVEGDDVGGGLILAEIRPDCLVLELKGKRFTYPRDGR